MQISQWDDLFTWLCNNVALGNMIIIYSKTCVVMFLLFILQEPLLRLRIKQVAQWYYRPKNDWVYAEKISLKPSLYINPLKSVKTCEKMTCNDGPYPYTISNFDLSYLNFPQSNKNLMTIHIFVAIFLRYSKYSKWKNKWNTL